jgi:hypothetical protein
MEYLQRGWLAESEIPVAASQVSQLIIVETDFTPMAKFGAQKQKAKSERHQSRSNHRRS